MGSCSARRGFVYLSKVLGVALLYMVTGKLGLLLAVPPGYATVIWPPSGIALGMLLLHGRSLWVGIFLGSLLLNSYISGAYSAEEGLLLHKLGIAAGIACGSTLQALLGRALISRFIGVPLALNHIRQVFLLFFLAGPVSCLVAASGGIAVLYGSGVLPQAMVINNWFAWWLGDMFGVLVFLPLMLVAPRRSNRLLWQGHAVNALPTIAMLALLVPFGLSFYAWKIASENVYTQAQHEFAMLAVESEKALLYRLDSYQNALLSGAGFFQSSRDVSRKEWRDYVTTLQLKKNLPGIKGIGWIKAVEEETLADYLKEVRKEAPQFALHPNTSQLPYYVITYIEPEAANHQAIGLNIAFEQYRREAAEKARDTGAAAITRKIALVQDNEKTPGFLLLHPLYDSNLPPDTVEARQKAFRGWIYAPFIAQQFLSGLTNSQGYKLNLRIYDGNAEVPDALIYSSGASKSPAFTVRKTIHVMQQQWLVVWESTLTYENDEASENPLLILVGGLLFTGLFGMFLLVLTVRRTETIEWMAGERRYVLPLVIFILLSSGAAALYQNLKMRELDYMRARIESDVSDTAVLFSSAMKSELQALNRMARRWTASAGTKETLWRSDAQTYLAQLPGLKALEWLDTTYHIRWAEPTLGNQQVIGMDAAANPQRRALLERVSEQNAPGLTEPFMLRQGYTAFIAYEPLQYQGKPDGLLAAVFSVEEAFDSIISKEVKQNYTVMLEHKGQPYYRNPNPDALATEARLVAEKTVLLEGHAWTLRMVPTQKFVQQQRTSLPFATLVGGLLIAALTALSVRYILISRLKSEYLRESNLLNTAILSSASYLIIATDEHGRVMTFNRAAEEALGYKADEVVGLETPALWHDVQEVVERAWELTDALGEHIEPGFDVFVIKARRDGQESREWTFIRKNGTRFTGQLTATALRRADGTITGYLDIVEDVTERKQAEQALRTSEETFRLAMENASIGNALVSPDGRWLKVNRALCALLGYSEAELLANDFQSITHSDDLTQDLALVEKVLAGKISEYRLEKRYYHKTGRVIWALLSVSLVRYSDGKPHYFIAQIQDISERREMERMKNEFISVVSHELRTPLTSIRGSLGLIIGAMATQLPDKIKTLIEVAHNNCERLILLINDILDMDKIASGEMRYKLENLSVGAVTEQAVLANEAYAEKYHVPIIMEPIDEHLRINVDAARYIQVLTNLLSNAVKFSPEGGKVHVRVQAHAARVRIMVKDTGMGIPEEFRERIFGKFLQADSSVSRSKGGTGLGLHITKQMVEHMGGEIGFDTETGKGTVFWVEFPSAT